MGGKIAVLQPRNDLFESEYTDTEARGDYDSSAVVKPWDDDALERKVLGTLKILGVKMLGEYKYRNEQESRGIVKNDLSTM